MFFLAFATFSWQDGGALQAGSVACGTACQVCLSDPRAAPASTAEASQALRLPFHGAWPSQEALTHQLFTVAPECDTLVGGPSCCAWQL